MNALNRVFTTNSPGLILLGTGCVPGDASDAEEDDQ